MLRKVCVMSCHVSLRKVFSYHIMQCIFASCYALSAMLQAHAASPYCSSDHVISRCMASIPTIGYDSLWYPSCWSGQIMPLQWYPSWPYFWPTFGSGWKTVGLCLQRMENMLPHMRVIAMFGALMPGVAGDLTCAVQGMAYAQDKIGGSGKWYLFGTARNEANRCKKMRKFGAFMSFLRVFKSVSLILRILELRSRGETLDAEVKVQHWDESQILGIFERWGWSWKKWR